MLRLRRSGRLRAAPTVRMEEYVPFNGRLSSGTRRVDILVAPTVDVENTLLSVLKSNLCVDICERMCYNWVIKNQPNRGGTTMETTIRRPGVMVYFGTIRPCLKLLNKTEQLQLFDAILDYAEFGDVPDFGGTLGTVWSILQVQLDRDFEAYARKVRRRKAAYDPDSYEE